MKRQRGRGRKPGGGGGGGGSHQGNQGNRSLESNGPEVKIRGTAAQIYEKYSQYARDAQSAGDRVKTENYLQHAEHYFRIMAATMPREQRIQQSENAGFNSGDDRDQDDAPRDPMKVVDETDDDDGGDSQDASDGGQRDQVEARGNDRPDRGHDRSNDRGPDRNNNDRNNDRPRNDQPSADRPANANANTNAGDDEGGEGEGQGRSRRRRQRRRHQDGEGPERAPGGDTEARSALDALAQKQAAVAGG